MTRNYDYPEVTRGSIVAALIRAELNDATPEERQELFKLGMRVIYGEKLGEPKSKPSGDDK